MGLSCEDMSIDACNEYLVDVHEVLREVKLAGLVHAFLPLERQLTDLCTLISHFGYLGGEKRRGRGEGGVMIGKYDSLGFGMTAYVP